MNDFISIHSTAVISSAYPKIEVDQTIHKLSKLN